MSVRMLKGEVPANFENHYRCPNCGTKWSDLWDSMCDDDCPSCGTRHISPYDADDLREDNE